VNRNQFTGVIWPFYWSNLPTAPAATASAAADHVGLPVHKKRHEIMLKACLL